MFAFYENNRMPIRALPSVDIHFGAHLHRQVELLLVLEGRIQVSVNGRGYDALPGNVIMLFPNTIHSYVSCGNSRSIILLFNPELAGEFSWKLTRCRPSSPLIPADRVHEELPYCMKRLLDTPVDLEHLPLIKGYLLVLLSRIFSCITLTPVVKEEDYDLIHQALVYITENFREHLTLEQTAGVLGVSKCHLSRMFSRRVGCGFNQYVNLLRTELAQQLLETSALSISQVAFECGFDSLRTFNRVFRENLQYTPSDCRRRLKNGVLPPS